MNTFELKKTPYSTTRIDYPDSYSIVLGTQSSFRRGVFDTIHQNYSTITADIDEKAIRYPIPQDLVFHLAEAKSKALQSNVSQNTLLITCDQVVVYNDSIREKPVDEYEARQFISSYSNSSLQIISSVYVFNSNNHKHSGTVDITTITISFYLY
ncbi:hypothetical protein WA158_007493 [Blastocystis sp. Blastoise]